MLELADNVIDAIERFGMMDRGDRVLVAVSGGADSVCLLDVLDSLKKRLDVTLGIVHVDHTTRDGESAADAEFVAELAVLLTPSSSPSLPVGTVCRAMWSGWTSIGIGNRANRSSWPPAGCDTGRSKMWRSTAAPVGWLPVIQPTTRPRLC